MSVTYYEYTSLVFGICEIETRKSDSTGGIHSALAWISLGISLPLPYFQLITDLVEKNLSEFKKWTTHNYKTIGCMVMRFKQFKRWAPTSTKISVNAINFKLQLNVYEIMLKTLSVKMRTSIQPMTPLICVFNLLYQNTCVLLRFLLLTKRENVIYRGGRHNVDRQESVQVKINSNKKRNNWMRLKDKIIIKMSSRQFLLATFDAAS